MRNPAKSALPAFLKIQRRDAWAEHNSSAARPWILLQLVVLILVYGIWSQRRLDGNAGRAAPTSAAATTSGGGAGSGGVSSEWPITSSLEEWYAAPDKLAYRTPQSSCLLEPNGVWGGRCRGGGRSRGGPLGNRMRLVKTLGLILRQAARTAGTARLPPDWPQRSSPFLFDTASMPKRDDVCTHCPVEKAPLCCGVCIFENRLCDTFYPGQNKSQAVADFLVSGGHRLRVSALLCDLDWIGLDCLKEAQF